MSEATIATIVVGAALALLGSALSALIVHYIKRLDRQTEARLNDQNDRMDRSEAVNKADHARMSKELHERLDRSEAANKELNAELKAGLSRHDQKLDSHGEVLTALKVEVGKLNVQQGRDVLDMLRGLIEASAGRKSADDD